MGQREAHFSLDFAANTEWAMQLRLAPALLQQLERASAGSEACTLQFAEGGKHVLRAGAKSFQLACQEETSSDMTVCALASDWARQTAREVGVIKLKGEVKMSFEERQRSGKLATVRPRSAPLAERLAQLDTAGGACARRPEVGQSTAVAAAGGATELVRVAALHSAGGARAAAEGAPAASRAARDATPPVAPRGPEPLLGPDGREVTKDELWQAAQQAARRNNLRACVCALLCSRVFKVRKKVPRSVGELFAASGNKAPSEAYVNGIVEDVAAMHPNYGLQLMGRARYDFTHAMLPELLGRAVPASPAISPPAASPSTAPLDAPVADAPAVHSARRRSDAASEDADAAPPLKRSKDGGGAEHDREARAVNKSDAAKGKAKKSKDKSREREKSDGQKVKRRHKASKDGGDPDGVVVARTVPVDTAGPPKVAEGPPKVSLDGAADDGPPKVVLGGLDDDAALAAPEPAWAEAVELASPEVKPDTVLDGARAVLDRCMLAETAKLKSEASFDPWDVAVPKVQSAAERDEAAAAAPDWAARAEAVTGRPPPEAEAVDESWFAEFLESSPSPEAGGGGSQMTRGEYERQYAVYQRLREVIEEALRRFQACQRAVDGAAHGSAALAARVALDVEFVRRAQHVERCEQALSTLQARLERVQQTVLQR